MAEGKETKKGVALRFIDVTSKLISGETFLKNTKVYSGSFRPELVTEISKINEPGAIPVSLAGKMYAPETVADLSSKSHIWEIKPELEPEIAAIRDEAIAKSTEEGLFRRVAYYENSIMCLANSLLTIEDTFSKAEIRKSWLDSAKVNLEWIKETVRKSLARVFEALGGLFDKVTTTVDDLLEIIKKRSTQIISKLVIKVRELLTGLLQLLNNIISELFGWLARLKTIASKKGFKLNKVTVTIDPLTFKSFSVFGFSIPLPIVTTPKIVLEFS